MKALIVYESMFGSTRRVAEAICAELAESIDAEIKPVGVVRPPDLEGIDLLLVGGPTHLHSLSSQRTRDEAIDWSLDPDKHLLLEPASHRTGIREWITTLETVPGRFAAFDTRANITVLLSGSAANSIDALLTKHGGTRLLPPAGFYITAHGALRPEETERARGWARHIIAESLLPIQ